MTMPQTSFLSEIDQKEPIPLGKLAYLRERTRNRIHNYILEKFIQEGMSQAELGRRIGKRPDVINRLLGAPGNWTIDTIVDLLAGISGEELEPHSRSLLGRAPRNHFGPDWLRPETQDWFTANQAGVTAQTGGLAPSTALGLG